MTNHVHILLTPNLPGGESLVFRDLGRDYVRQFNKRHGRTGTLWEGRFKSSLIDTDNYLLACYRYIELNPVRAGIVEEPGSYPWSSFHTNARGISNDLIVPHDLWLSLGDDDRKRREAYRSLFEVHLGNMQLRTIQNGLSRGLPTGDSTFKTRLEQRYAVKFGKGKRGRPRIQK
jgi:putative transposase